MRIRCISALVVCFLCLISFRLEAAPRCPLDVANPALTQAVIPLHGGPLQGVASYQTPADYAYFSFQEHTGQFNQMLADGAVVDEAGILLLRHDLGHVHLELCYPYRGEWPAGMSRLVLPIRARLFHAAGSVSGPYGELVPGALWDAGSTFTGNPMGVTVATGVFAFDLALANWQGYSNILRPALNGWTNFHVCLDSRRVDGAALNNCAFTAMYTHFADIPVETDFVHNLASHVFAVLPTDPGGNIWGDLITELLDQPLPLLAPFNTVWDARTPGNQVSRIYAADGTIAASRRDETRCDMDLHTGNIGRHLSAPIGVLDPNEIGLGVHPCTFISQTSTGPAGIPGVAGPNEVITSLITFVVEVGDGVVTPPPTDIPQDCVVGAWLTTGTTITATDALTVGMTQTRTRTTVESQQRPILIAPAHGGKACPLT